MKGKIPYNYVLIKPDQNFKSYQYKGEDTGLVTALDEISAGQRMSVRGTIIKLPERLKYGGEEMKRERDKFANDNSSIQVIKEVKESSMLYDVTIEPSVGDIVFFNYMEHYECYQNGRFIETEEGDLLLMRYDNLVASHKLNNIKSIQPLNGFILIEPEALNEPKKGLNTMRLEKLKHKVNKIGAARVLKTGKLCKGYMEDLSAPKDTNEFKEGQNILYKPSGAHLLEWGLHQVLFKGRRVMAVHRKSILMIQ